MLSPEVQLSVDLNYPEPRFSPASLFAPYPKENNQDVFSITDGAFEESAPPLPPAVGLMAPDAANGFMDHLLTSKFTRRGVLLGAANLAAVAALGNFSGEGARKSHEAEGLPPARQLTIDIDGRSFDPHALYASAMNSQVMHTWGSIGKLIIGAGEEPDVLAVLANNVGASYEGHSDLVDAATRATYANLGVTDAGLHVEIIENAVTKASVEHLGGDTYVWITIDPDEAIKNILAAEAELVSLSLEFGKLGISFPTDKFTGPNGPLALSNRFEGIRFFDGYGNKNRFVTDNFAIMNDIANTTNRIIVCSGGNAFPDMGLYPDLRVARQNMIVNPKLVVAGVWREEKKQPDGFGCDYYMPAKLIKSLSGNERVSSTVAAAALGPVAATLLGCGVVHPENPHLGLSRMCDKYRLNQDILQVVNGDKLWRILNSVRSKYQAIF